MAGTPLPSISATHVMHVCYLAWEATNCAEFEPLRLHAALTVKYLYDHFEFTSSGAISALVQGLLAKELWKRGLPKLVAGADHPFFSGPP